MPRYARILLALFPVTLLAACGQKNETPAPAAEATNAAADQAAAAGSAPISYDCIPALKLGATYDNGGPTPKATLTLAGRRYALAGVVSADGAKYAADQGRSPGKTLIWWTKGADGTLYEGKVGGTAADEKMVARCSPSR